MDNAIQITDLIEVEYLQKIQDAFAQMTGMASITTDVEGKPVTKPSNFTDFCMKHIRNSKIGCVRCEQCDKTGSMKTLLSGEPTSYVCHAGLVDYAAPIMAGNKLVGCFIGGQIQTKKLSREEIERIAEIVDVDVELLWQAASEVRILPMEEIEKASQFLYTIANIMSDMAYSKHRAIEAGKEMERAANMKSDFLANMSHEIRTPMNAVIGMAEMALREELPPAARDYITQIRSSGKALLTIINDILDFSKIESGKMDINVVEYEPLTIIKEVTNIMMTRLEGKQVDLLIDVDPTLPKKLMGDNIRLKQIIINIVNNAVKFTNKGYVKVTVSYDTMFGVGIMLTVAVEDTGIGIKEGDKEKLFESFQQLDSKRNRNIEGTGLGLAITQKLLKLMNGSITVESEYEKGSTFTISLPQRTVDATPCISVENADKKILVDCTRREIIQNMIKKDTEALGAHYERFVSFEQVENLARDYQVYMIEVAPAFDENKELQDFIQNHPEIELMLVILDMNEKECDLPNVSYAQRPTYTHVLALWFNGQELIFSEDDEVFSDFLFTAPEAEILVVDDNAINLTVTQGLLEPLEMKIDTALSGKIALDMINEKHYDLIFMDHMMPELDGVETTHIIRRMHPEYNDVPIIALTANAVDGAKNLFLDEGMNDFVPKPIELPVIVEKLRNWLPAEKMKQVAAMTSEHTKKHHHLKIGNLDTKEAIRLLGNEKLYWHVLEDYYNVIEKKALLIKELEQKEDWVNYTIEVHALKSASRQIGAMSLSARAAALEEAGNARDKEIIHRDTDEMLVDYCNYISVLKPYFEKEETSDESLEQISKEKLLTYFELLEEAVDNLDMDGMEEVKSAMLNYCYEDNQKELFEQLCEAINNIDVDACEELVKQWKSLL
ncbi:MAG: PocR ligand-binding domain-containing protein [Lachnospiraceae bacterium]